MEDIKYDASYYVGKTKVNIVSPETILGRKMTKEEIQKVLDDVIDVNREIIKHRIARGELAI